MLNPAFLSYNNIFGILQQTSELAVLVMGLTLVLITGKFDLSLESTFGLAPMVGAFLFLSLDGPASACSTRRSRPWSRSSWWAPSSDAFNGMLVVCLRFNAFIATLATLILLRGVSLGLTKGGNTRPDCPNIYRDGRAELRRLPLSFVIALIVLVVLSLFLSRHRAGRMLDAVGGNPMAARVAGVRVERVLSPSSSPPESSPRSPGCCRSAGSTRSPRRSATELSSTPSPPRFSAASSLNGGRGTMTGACGGVLLLVLIQNVLDPVAVPGYWISATTGAIILIALSSPGSPVAPRSRPDGRTQEETDR